MTKCKWEFALFAGLAILASAAVALEHDLPNPPPSEFVDAESSVNVPLPTDQGRRIRLTLAFESSPSNAVQVAFGNDLNGSENLEPEETELLLGVDCGEPYMVGRGVLAAPQSSNNEIAFENDCGGQGLTALPTNAVAYVFAIKQPRERWDLAKVTTHNLAGTNLIVTAEFYNRGNLLFLR